MKNIALVLILLTITSIHAQDETITTEKMTETISINDNKILRHVVLFQFKKGTTAEKIKEIESAFHKLPSKIKEISSYEWGLNNSPENLNKGFTHCFFLTFKNEEDRAKYLPHPDHKAFGELLTPHLEDVLVLDYWTN
ncbi:Dabb family protein [Cellulophaga sp. E16_2]|uniref:Dabb family protein n=1 Tax=Cellulophaga sp. E16_2 TaxID=2789297 RepID=UPI001A93999F|nr:Dabb family protein [Cellulophaga sp. E16_2]MBO0590054.1 Dabb family protein [Cellulophaga sp. E16_2]